MTTGRINQVAPCGPAARCFTQRAPSSPVGSTGACTGDRFVAARLGHARQPERPALGLSLHRLSARPRCILLPPEPGGSEASLMFSSASLPPGRPPRQSPPAELLCRESTRAGGILAALFIDMFAHRVPTQASHRRPLAAGQQRAALPSRLFPSRPSSEAAERGLTGDPAVAGCSPSRRAVNPSGVSHRVEAGA